MTIYGSFIWFSDEKIFTVAPPMNLQNDRVYVSSGMRNKQISAERLLKTRSNFSSSVMVSVAVSSLGCTELVFVEPGAQVNGAYYHNILLSQHLLPEISRISGGHFIFQQDSASSQGNHWSAVARDPPTSFHLSYGHLTVLI